MANKRLPSSTSSTDKVLRDFRLRGRRGKLKLSLFAYAVQESYPMYSVIQKSYLRLKVLKFFPLFPNFKTKSVN